MATWRRQGAVLISKGGAKIKGTLYTTASQPAAQPVRQVAAATTDGVPVTTSVYVRRSANYGKVRRKHGRQTRTPIRRG